jgi:hypothetical protein
MILFILSSFVFNVQAQKIQMVKPAGFDEAQTRIVQKLTEEFAPRLKTLLPTRIEIEKVKSSDPNKSNYTNLNPKKQLLTIRISKSITDPMEFASTVCHELGHIMAAGPISDESRIYRDAWIRTYTDVEGQCDYFAAMKCIPRLKDVLPAVAANPLCAGAADVQRCSLVLAAGKNAIDSMNAASGGKETVNFGDRTHYRIPVSTYSGYQDYACRLQTWQAAGMCSVDPYVDFSPTDEDQGACIDGAGARPRCWYLRGSKASVYAY